MTKIGDILSVMDAAAREAGALATLPAALLVSACARVYTGELALATELAWLPTASALFTLAALAQETGQPLAAVAAVYWALQGK